MANGALASYQEQLDALDATLAMMTGAAPFLGDLEAVAEAYDRPALAALQSKRKYRSPDEVAYPSDELRTLVPGYGKVSGARLLGHRLDPNRCCSPSFAAFVRGLDRLVREAQP